ncbi:MAG: class I SAM-dependent methyltransferase [Granulosicoccus sp.]|nr:class I SAM-dependent methyltransferase [Granulosicoccus sp.]
MDNFPSADKSSKPSHVPPRVAVSYISQGDFARAKVLAEKLNLPLHSPTGNELIQTGEPEYLLQVADQDLAIIACDRSHGPVRIDFTAGKTAHRKQYGGGRGQPLARALGIGRIKVNHVVDATAGLGSDAFVMATLGLHITLLEQSAILSTMLQNAIEAGNEHQPTAETTNRMNVITANAVEWLQDKTHPVADVIYLDPMYPPRVKSAQVKKGMQLLHRLIGPDLQSEHLLRIATEQAKKRVVVKRPAHADPLLADAADLPQRTEIRSPNTRYDIYTINP